MFFLRKYLLHKKYSFLREAVNVRRDLREYISMQIPDDSILDTLPYERNMHFLRKRVMKKTALWDEAFCFKSPEVAYMGGLDKARTTLSNLNEECEKWGIKV